MKVIFCIFFLSCALANEKPPIGFSLQITEANIIQLDDIVANKEVTPPQILSLWLNGEHLCIPTKTVDVTKHQNVAKCDALYCPGPPGPIKEWTSKDIEDVLGFCLPFHAHDEMAGKLIPNYAKRTEPTDGFNTDGTREKTWKVNIIDRNEKLNGLVFPEVKAIAAVEDVAVFEQEWSGRICLVQNINLETKKEFLQLNCNKTCPVEFPIFPDIPVHKRSIEDRLLDLKIFATDCAKKFLREFDLKDKIKVNIQAGNVKDKDEKKQDEKKMKKLETWRHEF